MAYYPPSIDAGGIHVPSYDDLMEHLTTQYKAIFGEDIYLGVDSKDYQMLSIFAKALSDYSALAVDAYYARSPLYATGDSLDVLCTLVGIVRRPSTYAQANAKAMGMDGTVIPAGSHVSDVSGELWHTRDEVTIVSGEADVVLIKDEPGKVELGENQINLVYDTIIGWEKIENTTVGTVGTDTESDEDLRARMETVLLSRAATVDIGIESSIAKLDGVAHSRLYVNDTSSTDENGIPSHSICAVVDGGKDSDIAQAIYDNKAPGIGTYGLDEATAYDATGAGKTISFTKISSDNQNIIAYSPKVDGIVYNSDVDLDALKSQIQQIVFEWGNTLGIGENCILSKAYPNIYSAIQAAGVAITRIYATENNTDVNMIECPWNAILAINDPEDVDVSGIVNAE